MKTSTILSALNTDMTHYRVWLTLCYKCPTHITDPAKEYCDRMSQFKRWLHDTEKSGDFSSWLTAYKVRCDNPILKQKAAEATARMKLQAIKHEEKLKALRLARASKKHNIVNWLNGTVKYAQ